ncbi:MAG: GMC family oxidoreductase [Hyphomonadaceae bacterium]
MQDYIIVGAGSAGCILANRLSEDPSARVTLLEAGGEDRHFLYRMPAGYVGLMKAGIGNWRYESTPQAGLNGRAMYFPRGKVLGGSGSINAMAYVRGNAGDFDHWAQIGNRGWSYEECLPYFRKLERFEGGADAYRGGEGPIGVSVAPAWEQMTPISRACMEAGVQAGYPFNPDFNGASQYGFARCNANIADGRRQSSSSTYLSAARARPNLRVITKATATRIKLRGQRAIGVEYVRNGRLGVIETDGEVILAGGAINSPQLLLLSGIGPAPALHALGVDAQHDLPGVGKNLQDHVAVMVKQEIAKPYSALAHTQPLRSMSAIAQYLLRGDGPATGNGLEAIAFLKTCAELEHPDIQIMFPLLIYEDHGRKIIQREGFSAYVNGSRPQSRGAVTLASADPRQAPKIDPRYLTEPDDIRVLRDAIRMCRELIAQPAFDDFRGAEYAPGLAAQSDADLDNYIRATAMSVYHPVGTCKMGSDADAVVDDRLQVRGLTGLRVADASVMPSIVSGNTNAATMMIAERAADFIKQS